MIPLLRKRFEQDYSPEKHRELLDALQKRSGVAAGFRIAETPIFLSKSLLDEMASCGAAMAKELINDKSYLASARRAIPQAFLVPGETEHPNFLTADFALVRSPSGGLAPRLVEIQAFPSVYGYQAMLGCAYRQVYALGPELGLFLGGLDETAYWNLLARTVLGRHDPHSVILTEVDPLNQKTWPDFEITARKLGITVVDIAAVETEGDRLYFRTKTGQRERVCRIYNRAIADEMIGRGVRPQFDLTRKWDVEWAGHPNWYFLISKFSVPRLTQSSVAEYVPPAVFLNDFLEGSGQQRLRELGVPLPDSQGPDTVYAELLLKPLFSFAGKGIQFAPSRGELEAIPQERRNDYLLQQKMIFVPTIETPEGPTQAEIRIMYLWPDDGVLTPAVSLVRLGRGQMMGVDHNRDKEFVGASAAFYPKNSTIE